MRDLMRGGRQGLGPFLRSALCVALALGAMGLLDPAGAAAQRRGKRSGKQAPLFVPLEAELGPTIARSEERNVPTVLILAVADEEASERFREDVMGSTELASRQHQFLCLVGNNGVHERKPMVVGVDEQGEPITKTLCEAYRTETCKTHQVVLDRSWMKYAEQGDLPLPTVLVLDPEGRVFKRLYTGQPIAISQVLASLDSWHQKHGPGLSEKDLSLVIGALDSAERAKKSEAWGSAWREARSVLALTPVARYADRARGLESEALAGMRSQHAASVELGKTEPVEAYKSFSKRLEEWADTPLEKDTKKALKSLERNKEAREAIKTYKRNREASALLEEARRLFRAGEGSKAENAVRTLLRKFGDTPAGLEAAKAYPGLVP